MIRYYEQPKLFTKIDDYQLELVNGTALKSGENHIAISIQKNGKTITASDLKPYLGAPAHIIMIAQKDKEFVHIHPSSDPDYPIYGHASIGHPGLYRMWVQFQTGDVLHTADFTIIIKEGKTESHSKKACLYL